MKAPLFSSYRQGENRVTSSILAVLERIDMARVEQLLAAASGESALEMVQFRNQPAGRHAVPDAEIKASFHYLFEVKTSHSAVSRDQLLRHLELFETAARWQKLFVLTPDAEMPEEVAAVPDSRVTWINFASFDQAIEDLLSDSIEPPSDREGFLLRELRHLLDAEGLVAPAEDTLVVAAAEAYPAYGKYSAYLCQVGRSFREGIRYLGFYTHKEIKPEFGMIEQRIPVLSITQAVADEYAQKGDQEARRVVELIEQQLRDRTPWAGNEHQVFLLSAVNSPKTIKLAAPIAHAGHSAWTRSQRYLRSVDIQAGITTTDQL